MVVLGQESDVQTRDVCAAVGVYIHIDVPGLRTSPRQQFLLQLHRNMTAHQTLTAHMGTGRVRSCMHTCTHANRSRAVHTSVRAAHRSRSNRRMPSPSPSSPPSPPTAPLRQQHFAQPNYIQEPSTAALYLIPFSRLFSTYQLRYLSSPFRVITESHSDSSKKSHSSPSIRYQRALCSSSLAPANNWHSQFSGIDIDLYASSASLKLPPLILLPHGRFFFLTTELCEQN